MIHLKQLSQKLRRVADSIDDLLGVDPPTTGSKETAHTAAKLKKSMATLRQARKKQRKAFSYKGKHWTQRPENRTKLRRILKAAAAKRLATQHAIM